MSMRQSTKDGDLAIWTTALRLGEFSYTSLGAESHSAAKRISRLVEDWINAGAVEFLRVGEFRRKIYRVKPGAEMPAEAPARLRIVRTAEQNMWAVMRRQGAFTPTDLTSLSNTDLVAVTLAEANSFCQMLVRAAYLRVVRTAIPGKREATYRLIKNTGPLPPMPRRVSVVYDENEEKIVHIAGVPK